MEPDADRPSARSSDRDSSRRSARDRSRRLTIVPPVLVGVACVLLGQLTPLVSPLLIALVMGAIVANSALGRVAILRDNHAVTKVLLRVGVVLLGLRLPLGDLVAVGLPGLLVIAVTVAATFTLTCVIGDKLGLDRGLVTLIAAGFSICGAAAIAAVESTVKRRDEDVALAIAMVTLFGTAMIMIMPLGRYVFGLSDLQLGVWAGASVHEVAQVVAAASFGGAAAVAAATTIKLGRVLCLAVVFGAARWRGRADVVEAEGTSIPIIPWFVVGFLLTAGLRTTEVLSASVLDVTDLITTILLAGAMFGLGMGIRFAVLFPVPWRVVGLGAASTAVAASVSLPLTLVFF